MTCKQKRITSIVMKGVLIVVLFLMPAVLVSIPPSGMAESGIKLRKIDPSHVCMTNNKDMGKPQIAVKVGEKTYYGCCKMCVGNLTQNARARHAVDPVTGKKVDKADAVIGAMPSGDVVYFENENSFLKFSERTDIK